MKKFTIGTDPEFFPRKDNKIVSVAGLLNCSKEQKLKLDIDVRLQEDNVLAEFDINPQCGFDNFNKNIKKGLDLVNRELNKLNMELALGVSSHIYTEDELKSFHESAFLFGCEPDYNAFTGVRNPSPKSSNPGLRTAGGHIHIGYVDNLQDLTIESQQYAGVLCDYYLSLLSVILDKDTRRKELYGKASCIRYKDYGIEYRSLSNFWVSDEELRKLVYSQVEKVVNNLDREHLFELHSRLPIEQLHSIINNNEVKEADLFLSRLQLV